MTREPFLSRCGGRYVAAGVAAALVLVACGGGAPNEQGLPGDAGRIDVELVADLSDGEAGKLAASVNDFGLDLHRRLAADQPGANVITSPLSVSTLLAMVAAGSEGQAAAEMVEVLGLRDPQEGRFAALLRQVSDADDVEVAVGNALWLDNHHQLNDDYATFVREVFGGTIDSVPLGDQAAADDIDVWVRERTSDRIDGIASDLGLPSDWAVLVLVNAVYFLGEWTTQFDPADTRDTSFQLADGEAVQVPTMHSADGAEFPVEIAEMRDFRMLRLPYGDDGRYVMDVLLPAEDSDLPALLEELDVALLDRAAQRLHPANMLAVALPTFELQWGDDVAPALQELGIRAAFSGGLGPMSPSEPSLGGVVHKTYIRVDETGTEAAAVTGGVTVLSSPPAPFTADRPFAFTITDTRTGALLFVGSVNDPRG